MADFLLGIDGGGSKTVALLAGADGEILGRGHAGSSNYHGVGARQACAALDTALAAAFVAAGVAPQPARALVVGVAGVDRPEDRAIFEAWAAARRLAARHQITNDAELVLAAGTPAGWGVALICGTGSIAFGHDRAGKAARAGGWGHLLGDEGSGYAIGLAALRSVARAADGRGPATALTGLLLQRWSLATPVGLFERVYGGNTTPAEIAALAPLVEQAAAADALAAAILNAAGRELAVAAVAVVHQLALTGAIPLAEAGGVILNSGRIAGAVLAAAADLGVELAPVTPVPEPARGALRLAQELR